MRSWKHICELRRCLDQKSLVVSSRTLDFPVYVDHLLGVSSLHDLQYLQHGPGEISSTTVIQMSLATSPWKSFRLPEDRWTGTTVGPNQLTGESGESKPSWREGMTGDVQIL